MPRTGFRGDAVEESVPTARAGRVLGSHSHHSPERSWRRREKGQVGVHLCLTSLTTNSLKRRAIAPNSSGTSLNIDNC
jgi:hypothetical protein